MSKYLIDANLPNRINAWQGDEFVFVSRIDDEMSDSEIWKYAKERDLTIVTKDSDFSHRIIVSIPPPKVVHIRIGNMRLRQFDTAISKVWPDIVALSNTNKLVNVFADHIEAFD